MKILINDYSGHPFQVELSRELSARGHQILHLYSFDFVTPKGDLERHASDPQSFHVEGVRTGKPFTKYNFVKRRGQDRRYAHLVCERITAFAPDLVLGCNNPLDAQDKIQSFCKVRGIAFVFWLQDLYSTAIKSILTAKLSWPGTLIGLWYERMEKNLLCSSEHIIPIADDFLPQLASWNVKRERITVIENWASLSKIKPAERNNAWAISHSLEQAIVILYTGTIGLKHNPDLLLAAAQAFASNPLVRVVVTSEGKYADYVEEQAVARGLVNLLVLPFQPFDRYSEVLATSDVLIAMIEPEAATYSVPSKVLSYLCSGRPIVLAACADNLAARTLKNAEAGQVVDPKDEKSFVAAIETYLSSEEARRKAGESARAYADAHFDIHAIADRFEAVFRQCVTMPADPTSQSPS
jgi:glycosyltransferase involved in cell wall biosynthesis